MSDNSEMITIPEQLQNPDFRFCLLKKKDKKPVEEEWQSKNNYSFDNPKLLQHIEKGNNYGIIGGYGNLIIIDADSEEINEKCKQLPNTFIVKTGSPEPYKNHYFFTSDVPISPIRLSKQKVGDLGDVRSTGQYVVAPGSIHPKGNPYKVLKKTAIANINEKFLISIFKDYIDPITSDLNFNNVQKNLEYKIDTTKRFSEFIKKCKVPDYALNNTLPGNISKNWILFPGVIDILNARNVSDKLYNLLAEKQNHDIGSVKGWVKSAKEGTLAKTSCKKMSEYLERYTPELVEDICGSCPLYEKIKEEKKKKLLKEQSNKNETLPEPSENIKEILLNPNLFNEITEKELDKKIVGEIPTRKVIFLCANGRLIKNCQTASYNLLVNDEAGTGKDYITGATLEILPKDCYIHKTRISPTVFTYWHNPKFEPDWSWNGKVFYPEDISETVLNSDVFKVMTSKGSSATVIIKQEAVEIDIKGKPVMITTTATATPNPELTRRFVILNLDSSEDQTKAIMKRHSLYKKEGIVPEYNQDIMDALKYLKQIKVKIPFADLIDCHFPNKNIIMRTNYPRFLDFISASAGLYQFQRQTDESGFILAEGQDYDIARECFLKLCSNKYMIPLTINQKKILGIFESQLFLRKSVTQLHADKMNFITVANLQTNLQNLAKYGILETSTDKDSYGRDMELYSLSKGYNPNESIEIPTYKQLMQKYNNINNNNNNNNTIISIIPEKGVDVIDVIDVIGSKHQNNDVVNLQKPQKTKKFISQYPNSVFASDKPIYWNDEQKMEGRVAVVDKRQYILPEETPEQTKAIAKAIEEEKTFGGF